MKRKIFKLTQFILFPVLGIAIIWWLYREQDMGQLKQAINKDVNYFWIIISLAIGLLSHLTRTLRWLMMIKTLDKQPRFINTFLALMIGYMANLALPRLGEVSRCAVLSKHENISFTKLIGTVVAERVLDIITLLASLIMVFVFQFNFISSLTSKSFDFSTLVSSFTTPTPYIIILAIAAPLWFFKQKIKQNKLLYKISSLWTKFKQGLLSFKTVANKPLFAFHSVLIFILYFAMMYANFFAFTYTSHLSPAAGLSVFVFGTLAMVAPVQGGIGPWHFMVITALVAYDIPVVEAGIFALVVHAALNLMIIVCGFISFLLLPIVNKNK